MPPKMPRRSENDKITLLNSSGAADDDGALAFAKRNREDARANTRQMFGELEVVRDNASRREKE